MRRVHDLGAAGGGAERHAGGDRLGGDEDVRRHAVVLDREQRAGAPEAALHLVGDHHDAVLVQSSRSRRRKRGGTGMKPPSPWTGSMMIAAISAGSTCAGTHVELLNAPS